MIIGIPKEIKANEYRVAAVPANVKTIVEKGHTVLITSGAGQGSGFLDKEYVQSGAEICDTNEQVFTKAKLIYKVKEIYPEEYKYLSEDKIIFTYIHSNAHPDETDAILDSKVTAFAYEDITDDNGNFPLLKPMSILAGKGAFLAGLHHMQSVFGGEGLLLANICGVETPIITIIGAGNSGIAAAEMAASFGNIVRMLDININALENAKSKLPTNVSYLYSNRDNLISCLKDSDILINCIMWPKYKNDHLVNILDLDVMKKNSMIIDVACDEKGAIESCHATTHDDPIYYVKEIKHYCVDNIPSAFSRTASLMLSNATLPYLLEIASKGVEKVIIENKHISDGLTAFRGKLTLLETAKKQNKLFTPVKEIIQVIS